MITPEISDIEKEYSRTFNKAKLGRKTMELINLRHTQSKQETK